LGCLSQRCRQGPATRMEQPVKVRQHMNQAGQRVALPWPTSRRFTQGIKARELWQAPQPGPHTMQGALLQPHLITPPQPQPQTFAPTTPQLARLDGVVLGHVVSMSNAIVGDRASI